MPSDADNYWVCQERVTASRDIGHLCRECKKPFSSVGETIVVRRGGRIEMRYHKSCYSGEADPRTQENSSSQTTYKGQLGEEAPKGKYKKMRTASQF